MLNIFKENFNKAKEFNVLLKKGEVSKLVMAPVIIEKKEEKKEEAKKEEVKKEAPKKEDKKAESGKPEAKKEKEAVKKA